MGPRGPLPKERRQFGKPIRSSRLCSLPWRDATEIEAQADVYNAARMKDAGLPFLREAAMQVFCSQVAERVASQCVESSEAVLCAGFPAEKYYRDAKIGKIYEGTSNMQLAPSPSRCWR